MKALFAVFAALVSVSALADPGTVILNGGIADGYDTVTCPPRFRLQGCQFDPNTCDSQSQSANSCSADSHKHRKCNITAICRRPVQIRQVQAGRAGGYDQAICPPGFRVQSCWFNPNSCDSTAQSANSCSADSRNNRLCQIQATCVGYF